MDMRPAAIVASVVLALSGSSVAQLPDPETIRKPHLVVLATTRDEVSGRQEANRAADRLGYPIARDTLRKPLTRRTYVGAVITLQRGSDGQFVVTSYLGDQADARKALAEARKHFANARLAPVVLPKDATDGWIDTPYHRMGILILGSHRSYEDALRAARSFSERSGQPYGSRGMIHDKERGLIWPDDIDDADSAGHYAPRREDGCNVYDKRACITVERSEGYEGFTPGLYIVVGGVLDRDEQRAERLAAARKIVPGAYLKQTTIYLGCTH
jgi:hypothetical protein